MCLMNTGKRNNSNIILVAAALLMLFTSCTAYKKVIYFRDVPDSVRLAPKVVTAGEFKDPIIQPNDILQISIQTIDPKTNDLIGGSLTSTNTGQQSNSQTAPGFLVDKNGFIELALIGRIKVAGMNTTEVKDKIHELVSLYYRNPVVNVRFSNFEITVIGDVNHPGTFIAPNERVNIISALGMAGDMQISGKRNNLMLIREENGIKKIIRLDMNSSDIFSSPYYYLKQRDILYVQQNKVKGNTANIDNTKERLITLGITVVTFILFLSSRLSIK